MKKLAVIVLSCSLLASIPMQTASTIDVIINTGITASIVIVGSGVAILYNGTQYLFQKDEVAKNKAKRSARYAFLIGSVAFNTANVIISPHLVPLMKAYFQASYAL